MYATVNEHVTTAITLIGYGDPAGAARHFARAAQHLSFVFPESPIPRQYAQEARRLATQALMRGVEHS